MNVTSGKKGFVKVPLEMRFWSKVGKHGPDDCWPWLGSTGRHGYGQIWLDGRLTKATRVSWSLSNKTPFPAELDACHSCDNPNCVNPSHIWPGTKSENLLDCSRKGRLFTPIRTRIKKTHCANGHLLGLENSYFRPNGEHRCRICTQKSREIYENKRKIARAALNQ